MKNYRAVLSITIIFVLLSVFAFGCGPVNELTVSSDGVQTQGVTDNTLTRFSDMDFTEMDALEFSKYLGNGINLGNTMEATGPDLATDLSVSAYETYWGQPVTTPEMIQGMKDCGFDTIRIPVAWTNMMDYKNGDYTIDSAYLDRVEEIVNYALDADMFVIINDHWDKGWWAMFGSSDETTVQAAFDLYESMWKQVAERFKDYSDMVIFESANEELGNSLNNNALWSDSGSLTENQQYEMTNTINQNFVDIIRNSGGNNDDRFLLIAGYNTDFDKTLDDRFEMPSDTVDGKLLVSVHYYTPWNYCGAETQASWGIKSEYEEMNNQFAKLSKFTDQGYGVIIGEYSAIPLWNNGNPIPKENTVEFMTNLLDNCDIYNYVPVLWSTNDLYNKSTCTMINDEIKELFAGRSYASEVQKADSYIEEAKERMEEALSTAPDHREGTVFYDEGTPVAWIMWNGGAGTYSVGDVFNPDDNTMGITATNAIVEGEGEYTVSLDFAGGNDGLTFAALALADGELLYPGCILNIKEITYDGEPVDLIAKPYTSSDDGLCTRVNLYNEWVGSVPDDARSMGHDLTGTSPVIIDKTKISGIKNITITFELIIP